MVIQLLLVGIFEKYKTFAFKKKYIKKYNISLFLNELGIFFVLVYTIVWILMMLFVGVENSITKT
jgi:hypothetical protein